MTPERFRPLAKLLEQSSYVRRGVLHSLKPSSFPQLPAAQVVAPGSSTDLGRLFHGHRNGRGINKWAHYLPAYERHLSRFRGKNARLLEIGVQSGGSLEMWRRYLGESCDVVGVDMDGRCKGLEQDGIRILIGDQADREFWRATKSHLPLQDVVIDDGGHTPEQQIVSLEEMLPHMAPGGVYICEDIYGHPNPFSAYLSGVVFGLHHANFTTRGAPVEIADVTVPNHLQQFIESIHTYPFLTVIEVRERRVGRFLSLKRGSQWL